MSQWEERPRHVARGWGVDGLDDPLWLPGCTWYMGTGCLKQKKSWPRQFTAGLGSQTFPFSWLMSRLRRLRRQAFDRLGDPAASRNSVNIDISNTLDVGTFVVTQPRATTNNKENNLFSHQMFASRINVACIPTYPHPRHGTYPGRSLTPDPCRLPGLQPDTHRRSSTKAVGQRFLVTPHEVMARSSRTQLHDYGRVWQGLVRLNLRGSFHCF